MGRRSAIVLACGLLMWSAGIGAGRADEPSAAKAGGEGMSTKESCPGGPTVAGNQHHNFLVGTPGTDKMEGYQGHDEMHGSPTFGAGPDNGDCMIGHQGNDTLRGYQGGDYMDGSVGNDLLDADGGNDAVYGDEGTDRLFGGAGVDYLEGANGPDEINGGSGEDEMYGGHSPDMMVSAEALNAATPRPDYVDCGKASNDTAVVDPLDVVVDCENVTVVP